MHKPYPVECIKEKMAPYKCEVPKDICVDRIVERRVEVPKEVVREKLTCSL